MKMTLKISLIGLAAGMLLMVMGTALGAKKHMYLENGSVRVSEQKEQRMISESITPFSNLDINIVLSDIEVISTGTEYKVEHLNDGRFEWSMEGDTLKIEEKTKLGYNLNVDLSFLFQRRRENKLKVYIPKNVELESLNIKNVSGDIDLTMVEAEKMTIDIVSGDLEANMIVVKECEARMISGDIEMEAVVIQRLFVKNASGDVEISGIVLDSEFSLISGDVELELSGRREDYAFDINNKSGDVYLNGKRSHDLGSGLADSEKKVKMDILSGDISLSFKN